MSRPIVPKEHGVWAVLYGSFLVGIGVAGRATLPVALFLVGISAVAFANGSLAILVRPNAGEVHKERRRHALTWFLLYGAVAHAVGAGEVRPISALLWLLLFLFFASSVFYVRMRVHGLVAQRRGVTSASNPARWLCLFYHVLRWRWRRPS